MWLAVVIASCVLLGVSAKDNETTTRANCSTCKDGLCTDGKECDKGCIDGFSGTICDAKCPTRCVSCDRTNTSCTECLAGFYGHFCQNNCSSQCKDLKCNKTSAVCVGGCKNRYSGDKCCVKKGSCIKCESTLRCMKCASNFKGKKCHKCKNGFFGRNCTRTCSKDCSPKNCSKSDGSCYNCKNGFWGQYCQLVCPENCLNKICNQVSGQCEECSPHYVGSNCSECVLGRYGQFCHITCPKNCIDGQCNMSTGTCLHGCKGKFTGDKCCIQNGQCEECSSSEICHSCKDGFYGPNCSKPCSNGCRSGVCNKDIGNCLHGCKADYSGDKCCLLHVGGNCSICENTSTCSECQKSFYGEACSHICPRFCKDNICNKNNGKCTLGCMYRYTGDRCCASGHCKQCLSDQECLTCKDGYYGSSCYTQCSAGCRSSKCNKETGACTDRCKAGYTGDLCCVKNGNCDQCSSTTKCKRCVAGYYGSKCNFNCSIGCKNNVCDRFSGKCTEQCKNYFTGDRCCQRDGFCQTCKTNSECLYCMNGLYGHNCDKNCSDGCYNKCNKQNGKCSCKYDYSGDMCCLRGGKCSTCKSNSECSECRRYYHGERCDQPCSYNCKYRTCNRNNGTCTSGCKNGYSGDKCCSTGHCKKCSSNTECLACKDGYWGKLCQIKCPAGCSSNKCNKETGVCTNGCKPKYSGDLCCVYGGNCDKCSSMTKCKQCNSGHYGNQCNSTCSFGCIGNTCDRNTGICTRKCKDNFTGDRCCQHDGQCKTCKSNSECSKCEDGYFGQNCDKTCSEGCTYGQCNKTSGTCSQCKSGYSGDMCCLDNDNCGTCLDPTQCNNCKTGFYGVTCQSPCPKWCFNRTCDMKSGNCFACSKGLYGLKCDQKCSNNCILQECSFNGTCYACKKGFYGQNCTKTCHENCKSCTANNRCDACQGGYYGLDCRLKCPVNCLKCTSREQCETCVPGYKGVTCEAECQLCKPGTKCRVDGRCLEACKDGYSSPNCDRKCDAKCKACTLYSINVCTECANGRYGPWIQSYFKCQKFCSMNCLNNSCKADSGNCFKCIDGYHGLKCECLNRCEQCNILGNCIKCKAPLANPKRTCECRTDMCNSSSNNACSSCVNATWFPDEYSSSCCPCKKECKNSLCVSKDECADGCEDGYFGRDCSDNCSSRDLNCLSCVFDIRNSFKCYRCKSGYFLDNSKCNKCPHTCINETCDPINGTCTLGCTQGRWGTNCKKWCKSSCLQCIQHDGDCLACTDGRYRKDCSAICSTYCAGKNGYVQCNITDGSCSHGCYNKRLYGKQCEQHCSANCTDQECTFPFGQCSKGCLQNQYGDFCNYTCGDTCKPEPARSSCFSTNGTCVFGCVHGFFGDRCEERCGENCVNSTCERNTGNCAHGCIEGFGGVSCSVALASAVKHTAPSVEIVAAIIAVAVIGLVVAGLVIFLFNKRKRGNNAAPAQEERENISLERVNANHNLAVAAKVEDNAAYENVGDFSKTRIPKESIVEYVANTAKEKFIEEFMLFPTGLTKPYEESQKSQNMIRNRYAAIYPYDHSRVILKGTSNDYINANYVHGYNKEREYIACLGPTSKAMVEFKIFWYMVWQEKVEKIVMLTNLKEPSGMKCEQYWPEPGTSATYGDVTVTCRDGNIFTDYIVKGLELSKKGETRVLHHVHYTAWPDKSIPNDVISMINFQQRVASLKSSLRGPIVVHCSAGVGRTGTFIALDYLCQQAATEVAVDIFACVRTLRNQRTTMVQTAEQYIYLHQAVAVLATSDCHTIRSECFADYVTTLDDNILQQMFIKLDTCMKTMGGGEYEAVERNRSHTDINNPCADIPGDLFRPRLTLNRSKKSSDYVNAVYLTSLTTKNKYLITQTPLENGVEDFLTLVLQEKCSVVVDLDPVMPNSNQQPQYLVENNKSKAVGCLKITSRNKKNSSHFIQRDLHIEMVGQESADVLSVKHFQYSDWSSCQVVPESPEEFIQFVRGVEREAEKAARKGPLLIHCRNAAERSCLFYVVALLLQKMETDHEVSVVTSVLQTRTRRHLAIPNMEQYLFCHHCVEAYLQTFETYSNFLAK